MTLGNLQKLVNMSVSDESLVHHFSPYPFYCSKPLILKTHQLTIIIVMFGYNLYHSWKWLIRNKRIFLTPPVPSAQAKGNACQNRKQSVENVTALMRSKQKKIAHYKLSSNWHYLRQTKLHPHRVSRYRAHNRKLQARQSKMSAAGDNRRSKIEKSIFPLKGTKLYIESDRDI